MHFNLVFKEYHLDRSSPLVSQFLIPALSVLLLFIIPYWHVQINLICRFCSLHEMLESGMVYVAKLGVSRRAPILLTLIPYNFRERYCIWRGAHQISHSHFVLNHYLRRVSIDINWRVVSHFIIEMGFVANPTGIESIWKPLIDSDWLGAYPHQYFELGWKGASIIDLHLYMTELLLIGFANLSDPL